MITGINHVTLSVRDVNQSLAFYTEVLGLRAVARWPKGAYLLAGDLWVVLVLDEHARVTALPEYTHIAFTVSALEFETLSHRIRSSAAEVWQENRTEGASLYFVDPNGHKLEIHASDLKTRLAKLQEDLLEGFEVLAE
jgi:catechol 2,3-dioxygenase-like lactoylglutathione lyase family enzyme